MARRAINVTFEVNTLNGEVAILRRRLVPTKSQPNHSRTVIDRYPLGFLVLKDQTPREHKDTLHAILIGQLGDAQAPQRKEQER